jgi:hypothetical protein
MSLRLSEAFSLQIWGGRGDVRRRRETLLGSSDGLATDARTSPRVAR